MHRDWLVNEIMVKWPVNESLDKIQLKSTKSTLPKEIKSLNPIILFIYTFEGIYRRMFKRFLADYSTFIQMTSNKLD